MKKTIITFAAVVIGTLSGYSQPLPPPPPNSAIPLDVVVGVLLVGGVLYAVRKLSRGKKLTEKAAS